MFREGSWIARGSQEEVAAAKQGVDDARLYPDLMRKDLQLCCISGGGLS